MKRTFPSLAFVLVGAFGLQACYQHSYVNPNATPGVVGYSSWHHHLIGGLINLSNSVNLQAVCPNGVAEIRDRHSFVNLLLAALTASIYTPTTVEVVCNGGARPVSLQINLTPESVDRMRAAYPNLRERLIAAGATMPSGMPNRGLAARRRTASSF